MKIRQLTVEDARSFWALRLFGLKESPSAFGSSWEESHTLPFDQVVEMVAERTTGPNFAIWGAFAEAGQGEKGGADLVSTPDGERLVGMMGFRRHDKIKELHKAYLWGVYVHPDFRGQGLGGRLLDATLGMARSMPGLRQIQLQATEHNQPAVALYRSRGFHVFGREPEALFVDGVYSTDLHMMLRINGQ